MDAALLVRSPGATFGVMRRTSVSSAFVLAATLFGWTTASAMQGAPRGGIPTSQATDSAHSRVDTSEHVFRWLTRYPWNGVNVWAGNAVQLRTASHNEIIDGSMRIVGVQFTRDVVRSAHFRLSYVGELLPALLVTSGATQQRITAIQASGAGNPSNARIDRYYSHDSYGVGLAPFGGEFSTRLVRDLNAVVNTTAGGVLFNHVVPYGDATNANFTVSPGAALQWRGLSNAGFAVGYTMHHLSNMHFGGANPGINSHIFYLRVTRLRLR